jgi:hypothetical protein
VWWINISYYVYTVIDKLKEEKKEQKTVFAASEFCFPAQTTFLIINDKLNP